MNRLVLTALLPLLLFVTTTSAPAAPIDESPLRVEAERAFPKLVWPDWLTELESGIRRAVRPVVMTGAGDGSNRMFVGTQRGTIHVFAGDQDVEEMSVFLDIKDRVDYDEEDNEEGFLGLAFHPKYQENGEFFVYYTAKPTSRRPHLSKISRFRVSKDDPNRADPDSEAVIMRIRQPFGNHNGGTIVFGPDGYLYVGLGDGGAANDPHMNGQNLQSLLGSLLRIDIDHREEGRNYAIPKDNPFVGHDDLARGEIWAYGLRNVWRVTFDRKTGLCWVGDVGQDIWEEIDIIERGGNYGWNLREGRHPFGPGGSGPRPDLIEPIWDYHHDVGKSITGGHVYRGKRLPELAGGYLYADWVSGQIWALWYDHEKKQVTANRTIRSNKMPIITFGEADDGEVYYATENGKMYRFRAIE